MSILTEEGSEFEGAILSFFHLLLTKPNKLSALNSAIFRSYAPNLSSLVATILVTFVVIYF
jgi:protein transport protein SEC61 subunit alpha